MGSCSRTVTEEAWQKDGTGNVLGPLRKGMKESTRQANNAHCAEPTPLRLILVLEFVPEQH